MSLALRQIDIFPVYKLRTRLFGQLPRQNPNFLNLAITSIQVTTLLKDKINKCNNIDPDNLVISMRILALRQIDIFPVYKLRTFIWTVTKTKS